MKNFMLLFISADYAELGLSPEEMQGRMGKWFAWNDKMVQAGIVEHGNALESPVRRIAGPERTVTDFTGAEVKELIGGYYIVKAENLKAASEIAQDYPDYDLGGTVEVRQVMVYDN